MPQADAPAAAPPTPARRGWKRWILPAVQALLTIAVLVWVFSDPGLLSRMGQTLRRAQFGWLAMGVLIAGGGHLAAAYRWSIFLRMQKIDIGFRRVACIHFIGLFFTLVLPGAMSADAIRVFYVFRERPSFKAGAVISVIFDHLAGLIAIMAIAGVFTFTRWEWFAQSRLTTGTLYFLVIAFGSATFALLATWLAVVTGFINTMPKCTPGRAWLIDWGIASSRFIHCWRLSLAGVAVSFVSTLSYFTTFYCAARAFASTAGLLDILSVMPVIDLVSALPLTISGLGVREKMFETMLETLANVPADVALLISLTGFGCSVVTYLAGGIIFPLYRTSGSTRRPRVWRDLGAE